MTWESSILGHGIGRKESENKLKSIYHIQCKSLKRFMKKLHSKIPTFAFVASLDIARSRLFAFWRQIYFVPSLFVPHLSWLASWFVDELITSCLCVVLLCCCFWFCNGGGMSRTYRWERIQSYYWFKFSSKAERWVLSFSEM